jgi:hypothetical protein
VIQRQAREVSCLPGHLPPHISHEWEETNLLLVKMKEKKLLKMQSLPKVLRSQAKKVGSHRVGKCASDPEWLSNWKRRALGEPPGVFWVCCGAR